MTSPFYITTPIYYVNARPHLGHAYTTIVADVASRFNRMLGRDTFFLTGTDEHGDKIVRAAKKEALSPRAYVDQISQMFRSLWPELGIENDAFIRTTDPAHIAVVKRVLQTIYDNGDIYHSEYEGLYCFGCERFYTERELVDGKCPDHQVAPEVIKEANYFFKMSRYQEWLIDHIHQNPDFIRPEQFRNEVLAFLENPLEDLCISRPKSRLRWGITLPFDEAYVTYVWFDALLNYVSAIGYPDGAAYKKYWPSVQHIVAKDILKPHGIYWPCMLKAADIPLYQHLNVHGYWNIDEAKMSKSVGNVIDPLQMKSVYGLDAFRFFLMRDMVFGRDSSFSEAAFITRINTDLANDLGNLFSRVITMAHKYFDGKVPMVDPDIEKECDLGLEADAMEAISNYEVSMGTFAFHKALNAVWEFISRLNKYIDVTAPWVMAKNKHSRRQLETVIYNLLEGLRIISGLIYPVMPTTARTMQFHLGISPDEENTPPFYRLDRLRTWKGLAPNTVLPKAVTLFPRIEIKKDKEEMDQTPPESTVKPPPPLKPEITYEDFQKVDLRVGTILAVEPVPRAKKLLKIQVNLGEDRTIVAGISNHYTPEELIGKQVLIVANLKPAKLMGILSNGMLLAAVTEETCAVATLDRPMPPGSPLR
jgi:methionyl-tRNA synthetase